MWFKAKKELRDVEERLERLERSQQGLKLEWENAYDKFVRIVQRFTKRAEQIEQSSAPGAPENDSPTGSKTVSSRLDPVSQRILDRRSRYFPSPKSEDQRQ